ncbi:hypothetical protein QYG89_00165 [Bacillus sp. B190/17]|uniref:Uncharacterized protein n=1 Tax=Bacillus lumedeiriae TaxID=3058829 RepID=A0ABW8I4J5_9BACI
MKKKEVVRLKNRERPADPNDVANGLDEWENEGGRIAKCIG